MCVLALFLGRTLTVAANRDEFLSRPSAPPQDLGDGIFGGKDLESGGTWLGLNKQGMFVAVTNRHAPARQEKSYSRGLLTREVLKCRKLG